MMSDYYADAKDLTKLLRPMNAAERNWYASHSYPADNLPQWAHAWHALYAGRLVADDIEALASDLEKSAGTRNSPGTKGIPAAAAANPARSSSKAAFRTTSAVFSAATTRSGMRSRPCWRRRSSEP